MLYEGMVYRPPSESNSLIIQVSLGCSYNACSFCSMYKGKTFRIRTFEEINNDLLIARKKNKSVKRIFLADGDAMVLKTDFLSLILDRIKILFPECERVGLYGTPRSILSKGGNDLDVLRSKGLGIVYIGVESGSDKVLQSMNKGVSSKDLVEAGRLVKHTGIKLSTMIISGLGGHLLKQEHANESAHVINQMNPDYLSLLTLMVEPETTLFEQVIKGEFKLLSVSDIMVETRHFIEQLDLSACLFRSNHASNYLAIGGKLPENKQNLLKVIDEAILQKTPFRNPYNRTL